MKIERYVDEHGYLWVYVDTVLAFKICQCGHMTREEIDKFVEELLEDAGFDLGEVKVNDFE